MSGVRTPSSSTWSTAAFDGSRLPLQAQAVAQKHGRAEDGSQRVGDALAGNIRRCRIGSYSPTAKPQAVRHIAHELAEGSMPIEPANIDASSVRMSPEKVARHDHVEAGGPRIRCMDMASTNT